MSISAADQQGFKDFFAQFAEEQRQGLKTAFTTEMSERAMSLKKAIDLKDADLARREAHGVKGTSATFGMNDLSADAGQLETTQIENVEIQANALLKLMEEVVRI